MVMASWPRHDGEQSNAYVEDHNYGVPCTDLDELKSLLVVKNIAIDDMVFKLAELEEKLRHANDVNSVSRKTINALTAENLRLKRKYHTAMLTLDSVKKNKAGRILSMETIKNKPEAMKFYTGFSSYNEFLHLYNFLLPDFQYLRYWGSQTKSTNDPTVEKTPTKTRQLTHDEELLMVLARLRVGLMTEDLAFRFGVHHSTVSRVCRTYFELMHHRFRQIPIFPCREIVRKNLPECFKVHYPSTRIILDCTELFIQTPSHFRVQAETYSSYKSHNTAKGLVGISPDGFISFVTDLVPGRTSDKVITERSGLINHLDTGDSVMADRGFLIDEYLARMQIKLNIPPFMSGKSQLSPEEEKKTRKVASVRIHVERAIERIKNYQILNQVFPNAMASELNKIWVICCYLVNFTTDPIVGK